MAATCIFIGAMEIFMVGWCLAPGLVHLLFLFSFHLHLLLTMLLHKSGSQQNTSLKITRTSYGEDKVHLT